MQVGIFNLRVEGQDLSRLYSPVWPSSAVYLDTQHAALVAINSLTPQSILTQKMLLGGTYTFYMLYRSRDGVNTASVQYYINGSPYDVAGSTTSTGLIGYTKIITVNPGDIVDFYGWVSNLATYCDVNRKDIWEEFSKPISVPWLYHYLNR